MDSPFGRWVAGPSVRPAGRPEHAQILPALLIGEYPTPDDAQWLRVVQGVTAVLSLQDDADLASKALVLSEIERAYSAHGVHFHRLPIPDCDTETFAARLDSVVFLLDQLLGSGERVYLHCNAGMNRAPTVAIAYLHIHRGLSLAAARDFVKTRRHCVPYMQLLEAHYATPQKSE